MSNRGGRRFNNRYSQAPRGGHQGRGQSYPNAPNGQFSGFTGNANNSSFRPHINKPQLCTYFQQGTCTNPSCQNLHQFTYNNEIGRLQQLNTNTSIFAGCLITESQVSIICPNKVQIFDVKTTNLITEFQIPGRTKAITYASEFEPGFLLFCGDSHGSQLLGAISLSGAIGNFNPAHAAGVSCMMVRRGLIFAGGEDAKVSVWYYTGQSFELGMVMEIDVAAQSQVTCIELVQNTIVAGLANGLVVGWDYNFETNQYVWKGALHLTHKGKVTALEVFNDCFIFSGGEDGIVNCWDASQGFTGGMLLNTTKTKPVSISRMMICESRGATQMLIGTHQGKILWYTLQQSDAKFVQPLYFHKKTITGLLQFKNLEGFCGFISLSFDGIIAVNNWNLS